MRVREFVHVAGPPGVGKTTFVEVVLDNVDRIFLAARCRRDDSLSQPQEISAKTDPELQRYRAAGAHGTA